MLPSNPTILPQYVPRPFSKTRISHIFCSPQISHILFRLLSPAYFFYFFPDPSLPPSILHLYIPLMYQILSSPLEPLKFPFPLIGMITASSSVPSAFSNLLSQFRCQILKTVFPCKLKMPTPAPTPLSCMLTCFIVSQTLINT